MTQQLDLSNSGLYTMSQAAKLLSVRIGTLRYWIKEHGDLHPVVSRESSEEVITLCN